ncbi:F0F1 ATP synthase subunit A [Mycoplasma sp. CSL10137]|uniref:F0F1 ATP synthase subunit A n=1 Tax=unclassified Mycoplasma TaxID=2683645 RepID=UPI00197C3495|nr:MULTISPECIES: F0F1 ATP synthase subunit A [unclassified Mycoplasma]MBN4083393.1 F0F1 ATP synthase subunit A [Mycoplasma sp. CSL10137]MBN4084305.1 F0F1 ATP synthase subunit A [Mycoplasma sp. CSL10166]MBU4692777.1 F0F1 ATP synthase subunit A [Mycoplasma sp. CSL7491-lung]MCU4706613.1 F0F1 ATP synthase subunit A [Mycoplasma sp. CSL7503-lung]
MKIIEKLWVWNLPQLLSLFMTVLIIVVLSIIAFIKVKKVKNDKSPTGVALIAESYVKALDDNFDNVADGSIPKAKFYIFTLGTFLVIGNLLPIIGLKPIGSSISVPFTLALMTWMGVFVAGAIHRKRKYIKDVMNPMELIGKFGSLISLSARMYGNLMGGAAILLMVYALVGNITIGGSPFYYLGSIFTPVLHFYFDIFGAVLQAIVFTLLTIVYWKMESEVPEEKPKKFTYKIFKNMKKNKVEHIY